MLNSWQILQNDLSLDKKAVTRLRCNKIFITNVRDFFLIQIWMVSDHRSALTQWIKSFVMLYARIPIWMKQISNDEFEQKPVTFYSKLRNIQSIVWFHRFLTVFQKKYSERIFFELFFDHFNYWESILNYTGL